MTQPIEQLLKEVVGLKNASDVRINPATVETFTNVQAPISVDGDSIYAKDVNVTGSDMYNFTGAITDIFDSLTTTIVDSTANTPKQLLLKLNRPIDNGVIKLCTNSGNFSNVKIYLRDGSDTIMATIDDSGNNTKETSKEYATSPTGWCNALIEFHTTDAVTLSFVSIQKAIHTHSMLVALKPDGTQTPIDATASGNLKMALEEYDEAINPVRSDMESLGKLAVGVTAVELAFTGTPHAINIDADPDNTGLIYIGKSDVTSAGLNAFAVLEASQSLQLDYDDTTNAIYVVSDTAAQNVIAGALL